MHVDSFPSLWVLTAELGRGHHVQSDKLELFAYRAKAGITYLAGGYSVRYDRERRAFLVVEKIPEQGSEA